MSPILFRENDLFFVTTRAIQVWAADAFASTASSAQLPRQSMQHPVAGKHLVHAGVRLAPRANGGEELGILSRDAVRDEAGGFELNGVAQAVRQLVITRDIRRAVADVAKC